MSVRVTVVDHPVVADTLAIIRDASTSTTDFSAGMGRIAQVLALHATADLPLQPVSVQTPLATMSAHRLSSDVAIIPVLRAGLTMVEGLRDLIPTAAVGMIGMARDEHTHVASTYLERLPADLATRRVIVTEPMIATGGSLIDVVHRLRQAGATGEITVMSLLAAPEGLARVQSALVDVHIVVAAIDERLDDNAFIVPGLGDAGDRAFGTI